MNPRSSVLRVLRSCFVVNFSRSRKNETILSFFFNPPWSNGVKNTVCLVFTTFSHPTWMTNWMNILDVTPTPSNCEVSGRGPASQVRSFLLCVLEWLEGTTMEFCFVASYPDEVETISVSETASTIFVESDCKLWTYDCPMNCPLSLSFSRMLMSCQFTHKIWDLGFPAISAAVFIGWQVIPNSLMNTNMVFWPSPSLVLAKVLEQPFQEDFPEIFLLLDMTTETLVLSPAVEGIWSSIPYTFLSSVVVLVSVHMLQVCGHIQHVVVLVAQHMS